MAATADEAPTSPATAAGSPEESAPPTDEALELTRRAKELNPLDPGVRFQLGISYYVSGDYDRAIAEFDEQIARALDSFGRPIPNMPMIGALLHVKELMSIDALKESLSTRFKAKFSQKVIEGNLTAVSRAYEEVVSE